MLELDDPKPGDGGSSSGNGGGATSTETHRDGGTTVPKTEN